MSCELRHTSREIPWQPSFGCATLSLKNVYLDQKENRRLFTGLEGSVDDGLKHVIGSILKSHESATGY